MKAAVCSGFGGPEVVQMRDLPVPVPKAGEVLVRIRATTVNSADWRIRSLSLPRGFGPLGRLALGFSGPRQPVLGTELAGDVVEVGSQVTRFRAGDPVFAFAGSALGCHAEYRTIAADAAIAPKPGNLSYEQAAALSFGGATMLDFFRRARLGRGEHVLVNGASGTVGSAAVQLARQAGARVTAVCGTRNVALVASLGAQTVIDYTREDFARQQARFDVIVDTIGNAGFERSAPLLAPGGRLLLVLADLRSMLMAPWHSLRSGRRVIAGPTSERPEYIGQLRELALAGEFVPIIDRSFEFDEIQAAHACVDAGHKTGSVVVRVAGPATA